MNDPQSQRQVSIEDLLHIKRAERPEVAFWAQFEEQMRAKQLAALVRKDPWWRSLPRVLTRHSRLQVPVGATAVLALAFVTVREFRAPASPQVNTVSPAVATASSSVPVEVSSAQESSELANAREPKLLEQAALEDVAPAPTSSSYADASASSAQVAAASSETSSPISRSRSFVSSSSELAPSARSIAANLAEAEASEPRLAQLLEHATGLENVFVAEHTSAVEPLTQVVTPRDTRRARLLASAVPADLHAPETSASRSRERITSHLREESLYDSITRLGLNGNRVSIKF